MHNALSADRPPFLSPTQITDRVADRSLGLLAPEQVAVDRLLMSLDPASARLERETLDYLAWLDASRTSHESHPERFACLFGRTTPPYSSQP